jgi:hypothetical protein
LPKRATIAFVDGKDKLLHFQITMRPDEGIYRSDCETLIYMHGP